MLTLPGNSKFLLCREPISMHKSFEGLSAAVEEAFPGELLSGSFFIFLNRKQDHMKVLYWDIDGLAIWFKRLEKGTFSRKDKSEPTISRREFMMLLEGVTPKKVQMRYAVF
jgi:transposase